MKKPILFQNENEMSFWMGIYQTAMRTEMPAVSCEYSPWEEDNVKTPDVAADDAVRELRRRMEPPVNRYHNSPEPN